MPGDHRRSSQCGEGCPRCAAPLGSRRLGTNATLRDARLRRNINRTFGAKPQRNRGSPAYKCARTVATRRGFSREWLRPAKGSRTMGVLRRLPRRGPRAGSAVYRGEGRRETPLGCVLKRAHPYQRVRGHFPSSSSIPRASWGRGGTIEEQPSSLGLGGGARTEAYRSVTLGPRRLARTARLVAV